MCAERKSLGLYYAGGFAEYMLVPAVAVSQGNVLKVPESVSFEEAAMVEPVSCCLNAQDYLRIGAGDRVVVLGAGAMGCIMLLLARHYGAGQTIAINGGSHRRLELARRVGADHYLSGSDGDPVAAVREWTGGDGADVVIVAASAVRAQEQAVMMAGRQGRVSFFASVPAATPMVSLDGNWIHYNEISIFGAFSSHRRHADTALSLIAGKRLDVGRLITHRLSLDEIERGIAMKRSGEAIKAVVLPWGADRHQP
jgi:L-iditol 2-dehydrogenase